MSNQTNEINSGLFDVIAKKKGKLPIVRPIGETGDWLKTIFNIKRSRKRENSVNKDISNGVSGALARLKEDTAVLRRIFRPKENFSYFDKNTGQHMVTTFRLTGHGTFKFDGTRTISEKELFAITDKKHKKGKLLIFDKNGRVIEGRRQLSSRKIEMFNIVKQIKEGKLPVNAPEFNEKAKRISVSAIISGLKNRKNMQQQTNILSIKQVR